MLEAIFGWIDSILFVLWVFPTASGLVFSVNSGQLMPRAPSENILSLHEIAPGSFDLRGGRIKTAYGQESIPDPFLVVTCLSSLIVVSILMRRSADCSGCSTERQAFLIHQQRELFNQAQSQTESMHQSSPGRNR